jgi:predicted KAP-like P-loop ATPase
MWVSRWIADCLAGRGRLSPQKELAEDILYDRPINDHNEDRLRRGPYTERVAEILSIPNRNEGRIFAIRGEWGQGKSSLKHLIIRNLEKMNGARCLEFNAWQWGSSEAITRKLFVEIADTLSVGEESGARQRAERFRRYAELIQRVNEPVSKSIGLLMAVIAAGVAGGLERVVSYFTGNFGSWIYFLIIITIMMICVLFFSPWLLALLGRDKWSGPIDAERHKLGETLKALDHPLVIFVDDIDRLDSSQIFSLISHIKANANLPMIVFVLIFQDSIVEYALDQHSPGHGKIFLEKIVQASFDLPNVPQNIVHSICLEDLEPVIGRYCTAQNGFDDVRWGNVWHLCIKPHVRNLRDAKRYLTSVQMHLKLHANHERLEVNLIDFLCLEALRVFEAKFFYALSENENILTQGTRSISPQPDKIASTRVQELIAKSSEEKISAIQETIRRLFPNIEWTLGGTRYSVGGWATKWYQEKRVCHERCFPRYFELQTPLGDISEKEFLNLIESSGDAVALRQSISALEDRNLLEALAIRLDEAADSLPETNAAVLLPEMSRIGQSLVGKGRSSPLNSAWMSAWRSINRYLRRIPEQDREILAFQALNGSSALSVWATIIRINSRDERPQEEDNHPIWSSEAGDRMKLAWVQKIRDITSNNSDILAFNDLPSLLYSWGAFTKDMSEPKAWLAQFIVNDYHFVSIIRNFKTSKYTTFLQDVVGLTEEVFDRKVITDFLDLEVCRERLGHLDFKKFSLAEQKDLRLLQDRLNEWLPG